MGHLLGEDVPDSSEELHGWAAAFHLHGKVLLSETNGKSLLRRCEIGKDFAGGGQDRSLDFMLLGGVARGQG